MNQNGPLKPCVVVWLLLLLYSTVQSQAVISGRVMDAASKPLAWVSVVLLRDSIFLTGTSTDDNGRFNLSYTWEQHNKYSLQVTLIGYKTRVNSFTYPDTGFMQHIVLGQDQHMLTGVTVTAKAPLITRKADRYIVSVENSFLSDGYTGLEVLKKAPGIWVDNNGTIRIKGTQPAMVMINDVVQRMSADELMEYLKTLKSEDISRIEIIQNPPSEFEASGAGGIVHIILKRSRKDGLNGSVNALYRYQGKRPYANTGFSLNYKNKNWYLTAGYTFSKDQRNIKEAASITYPDNNFYSNSTDRKETIVNHQYRLGISYDLSASQSIGIQTVQNNNSFHPNFNTSIQYDKGSQVIDGINYSDKDRRFRYGSTTLNYIWKTDTLGSMIKVIGDYTRNNKKETNDYLEQYSEPSLKATYRNQLPFVTNNYSAQADYTRVLQHKTTLKGGIKYSSIRRDNTIVQENYTGTDWVIDSGLTNRFIYTESLLMFYSSFEKTIKKTSIQAGLRGEETFSRGNSVTLDQQFSRNYFSLFPSLFIMHTLNEKKGNSIYINYSRRLSRPGLQNLNPFPQQFNNYTVLIGNPRLLPQYAHSIGTGFRFLNNYSADLFITKTENVIILSANPGPNNSIKYMSENVNSSMDYGLELSALFTIVKGWTSNNNFSLTHTSYRFNEVLTRQTAYNARSIHTIVLEKIIDIDAEAEYRSPYTYSNIYNPSNVEFDIGFTKRVWKGKGRIRLYISDLFNTSREKEITLIDQTSILFYRKRQTRGASLSFTWNFSSGKKFSTNKIDQSNTEEKGRIGN
jgi:Outer membrane protein beta-barrel family/CarboxypepD_reg-like domain